MNIIIQINRLYNSRQTGNPKDFFIFVLEQLHKELKTLKYQNNNEETSIISKLFFGSIKITKTNKCPNCKNNNNSQSLEDEQIYYNKFNCLIFPLEEVRKMKSNSNQYNSIMHQNNRVNI